MPIIEIFALTAPEFFATAAPEISAEVLAAQTASTMAPEVVAATEAATATAPTTMEAAQTSAELAPEVSQAAQGITQASPSTLEAAQLKTLTTPQGITQALTAPEAVSVPGANAGAGGAGINALQTNAVNQLALGPGPQVAGTGIDTVAGAKPIDIAGVEPIVPAGGQPSSLQLANTSNVMSDVGGNPTWDAWQNALKSKQTIPQDDTLLNAFYEANNGGIKVPGAPANAWTGLPNMSGQIEGVYPGLNAPGDVYFNSNLPYASQVATQSPFSTSVDLAANAPTVNVDNTPSALERGFSKAMKFVENNPIPVAAGIYSYMNQPQAYQPQKRSTPSSLAAYRMSPNFQASTPTPNVYRPRYADGGGIMMAAGGSYDDEPRGDDQGYGYADGGSIRGGFNPLDTSRDAYNYHMATAKYSAGTAPTYEEWVQSTQSANAGLPAAPGTTFDTTPMELGQSNPFSNTVIQNQPIAQSPSQPVGQTTAYPNPNTNPGGFAGLSAYLGGTSGGYGSSGGGSGGPFPLEGQYGIVKMASGGIAGYAAGGSTDYDTWLKMTEAQKYPDHLSESVSIPRTGIMYDTDPDTRYKDALTASMIRMGKINKKAGYEPVANLQRPKVTLGQIETGPAILKKKAAAASADDRDEYAAGGITQVDNYALGGYASGSVPRLLKGPGDGMSDDIPATIDGRQPARLADGEFVIPADVVSGLGNGSTDAGAKHLHKMMTDVRKARTGNPKQGKQIQAEKFMPKKKHA